MNQHEIIPTLYNCISMNKKKMKLRLIAITITLSSQPDLGTFSHHRDLREIQFLCSSLHLSSWHSAKQHYYFHEGKKDEAQKTLKTFSKVLRNLTKQEIEASPSDHQLNAPVMGCLCSTDGACTSHSFKHHRVRQQQNAQDAFNVALSCCERPGKEWFPCLAASQARSEAHLY